MASLPDPLAPSPDPRAQRIARITLAILVVLFGLWLSATFLPSLAWAAIIAIAIDPLYTRAEARWPGGRGAVLPAIATTAIALIVVGPLAIALVEAAREAHVVVGWLSAAKTVGLPEPTWLMHLPYSLQISHWWQDNLATPEGSALQRFNGEMLLSQSQLVGKGLLHRTIVFLFTLLALFFLLRERDTLVVQLRAAGARLLGPSGDAIGLQLVRSVRGTIDGLVLVGLGEGAVMAVVYLIAGVPHPFLLGLLTAVAAMIPFGAAALFAVACAMLLAAGSVGWAIAVFAIGMGVVFVADHFIRPFLIGGSTRLPFLWVLVGILGGVETMGLLGLFVGPATMAVLILLWREWVGERERVSVRP